MIYLFFEIVIDIDILCPLGTSIERFLVQVFARRTILFTLKRQKGAEILESIVFRTFDIEKKSISQKAIRSRLSKKAQTMPKLSFKGQMDQKMEPILPRTTSYVVSVPHFTLVRNGLSKPSRPRSKSDKNVTVSEWYVLAVVGSFYARLDKL